MTSMKVSDLAGGWGWWGGLLVAGLFLAGCGGGPKFAEIPGLTGGAPAPTGASTAATPAAPVASNDADSIDRIHVGDSLLITFSDLPGPIPQQTVEDRVRETGRI